VVLIRIYARFIHTHTAAIDDWLAMIALLPAICLTVTISLAVTSYGWSMHIWDFQYSGQDPSKLINERAISWASQMLYLWSSSLTKLSLLYFYRRIFTTTNLRLFVQGSIYFVWLYFGACFLTLLLECRPLTLYWHILILPEGTGGVCADEGNILLAAGLLNVFIDVVILILPISTVLKLHVGWPQKLQVLGVFMTGTLVCVSSMIRIAATWTTVEETYDVTWAGYLVWMWVGIEVDVGLICASVPACKSLFKSWRQKLDTRTSQSDHQDSGLDRSIQKTTVTSIQGSYVKIISVKRDDANTPDYWVGGSKCHLQSIAWAGRDVEEIDLDHLGEGNPYPRPTPLEPILRLGSKRLCRC
jgi:hypothetical protein